MARSRADFLREMGLSTDDVVDPAMKPTKFPTKVTQGSVEGNQRHNEDDGPSRSTPSAYAPSTTTANRSTKPSAGLASPLYTRSDRDVSDYYSSVPEKSSTQSMKASAPMNGPSSSSFPTVSANSQARAEFLRSMGLSANDMVHPDTPSPTRAQPASGSFSKENAPTTTASSGYATKSAKTKAMIQNAYEDDDEDDTVHAARFGSQHHNSGGYAPQQPSSVGGKGGDRMSTTASSAFDDPKHLKGLKTTPYVETDIPADATADDIKTMGNQAFEVGDFRKAVRMYSRAIDKDPRNAALYSNRSAAYLQGSKQMGLDTRSMALRDADKAIELKPAWFKGYSRRGDALFKLERWVEAVEAYEVALKIDPTNTSVQFSLRECQQMLPQSKAHSWSKPRELETPSTYAGGYSGSASAARGPTKSAHELLNELRRDAERTGTLIGHDYRDEALSRFRQTRTGETASVEVSFRSEEYDAVTKPQLDKSSISEEFSSSAAAAYQRSLLDAYRKKKGSK